MVREWRFHSEDGDVMDERRPFVIHRMDDFFDDRVIREGWISGIPDMKEPMNLSAARSNGRGELMISLESTAGVTAPNGRTRRLYLPPVSATGRSQNAVTTDHEAVADINISVIAPFLKADKRSSLTNHLKAAKDSVAF